MKQIPDPMMTAQPLGIKQITYNILQYGKMAVDNENLNTRKKTKV